MNALEWNGNHETSSLHKEEVVLQACQIKEWHHIIFVNADSSSSIIRQTWKVLFSYHMVRHHFPFISEVSSACLSRSPASFTAGNLQKLRKCDRKSNHLCSRADLFKMHIPKPLAICLCHQSEKTETLSLHRRECYVPSLSILNQPATTFAILQPRIQTVHHEFFGEVFFQQSASNSQTLTVL